MANDIQLKRSSVVGRVPDSANVLVGEPVINLADKKMYTKNGSGDIIQIASGNLQGLADVSNASPTSSQVLTWTGSVWAPQDPTGTSANVILGVLVQNSFVANGTGTTYTLTNSTSNANALIVFVDSVLQEPLTNYTISGTTLTFTSAPSNGANVDVRYFAQDEFDIAIGELNNVSNATPLTNQALIWNGSEWAPANVSTSANVISVNGQTGVVTLTTTNINEGSNLYYTNARARGAISVTGAGSYDSSTGVITITGGVTSVGGATGAVSNTQLASAITSSGLLTTSNVSEGTNLYFSNARVATAVASQTLSNATFSGDVNVRGELYITGAGGDEGGQINLQNPVTNSTLSGQVVIDVYQNKLRIFEKTGTNRGAYLDLTSTSAGVATNLIGGSGTITSVAGVTSGAVSNIQLATATVYSQTLTNATFSSNVTADKFISNNNGNGENYRIGDDVWIGDYNIANSLRIKGVQDPANAFISFGNSDSATLGRTGTGNLTYTAGFNAASLNATANVNGADASFTSNVNAGNVTATTGTFTNSRLGTVQSGTWNGASISTTYTDAKITSVANQTGAISNAQLASAVSTAGIPSSALNTDVALGTQTSGAYVSNLVAGTGVTITGLGNEGATPTIAIGQAVGTNNNVTFASVTVTGNLTVQGNAVIFESNTLAIIDPLIQVGKSPVGDAVDLGFFGHYIGGSPSTERHAGLFRDATDGQFKLFTNLDPEPTTIVDTANASYQSANLVVNFVVGKVSDISNHTTTSLSEGTNLYFTNARVSTAVSGQTLSNATFSANVNAANVAVTSNTNTGNLTVTGASRLGTVSSGIWNGTSIDTAYTNAKVISVGGVTGTVSNAQVASAVAAATVANITVSGTSALGTINGTTITTNTLTTVTATGRVSHGTDAGGSISLGNVGSTGASTPYIDFNSGATTVDYDARIQVSGGNGTTGKGNLSFEAATVSIAGNVNIDSGALYVNQINNRTGINTTSPSANLHVVGNILSSANVNASYFVGDGSALTNIPAATVLFQDARPSSTSGNVLWWQSNVGKLKVYYNDGTSAQWIDANPGGVTNYYENQVTVTNETASSSTYYPVITTSTSGNLSAANVTTTKLSFVPSTGVLTVTDLNTTSDASLKENIFSIPSGIEIIEKINPVSFKWKDTKKESYGVLAQELESVLPELVSNNGSGKAVSYIPLISFLIKAVQEQQAEIKKLKRILDAD